MLSFDLPFLNADHAYEALITNLLNVDNVTQSRAGSVKELSAVSFSIAKSSECIILNSARKLHYAYAFMEMMGLFAQGRYVQEMLMWYCPALRKIEMNPDTGLFDGHYGERLMAFNQFDFVIAELCKNPESRRAVMTMYNPARDMKTHNSFDVACTLALQFRIRGEFLDIYAMMRSNDIFLGLPYDLTQFTFLQHLAATILGLKPGFYYHYTTSLHAYERDFEKLEAILKCSTKSKTKFQTMPDFKITATGKLLEKEFMQIIHYDRLIREGSKNIPVPANAELQELYHQIVSPFLTKKGILLP